MRQPWHWYVYIIECQDGTYYTGCTWDLALRYEQHRSGKGANYTKMHGVKSLVYAEYFESLETARYRERQIQRWSQKKKRKLISGEWSQDWEEGTSRLPPRCTPFTRGSLEEYK